jgi:hypothetical protein
MSTLKSINVQHPSSATINIVNDSSGNVAVGNNLTVAGTATVTGTVVMGSSFKRSRIINGNMVVDQRNAGASVTPNNSFTLDRWLGFNAQTGKYTVQQNSGSVTGPTGFTNYLGVVSSSAYSVVAGDYFGISQTIEGFNTADLGYGTANAQTVTISFWVRSSLTGTFSVSVRNYGTYNRSYPATYTISAANTWEYKTITIAGDTTGTWTGATNSGSLLVSWPIGCGSTYSGTANAWQAGNIIQATGSTSVVGTSGATFFLTGVQLEVGTKATPYEMQIYSDQLAQCQRYCYVATLGAGGYGTTSTTITAYNGYAVTMRTTPTLSAASITYGNASGLSIDTITAFRFRQVWTVSGNGGSDVTYTLTATAEL